MDLLEYQAKELFREMGIPVLPSQRIDRPQDLKGLRIPYPVVLKSQVRAGGRGKAGGVKFVETTIDAVAAAQAIFHLPIMGEYPEVLLAEAKYNAHQEFYLAVVLDTSTRRPVLLGSQTGGVEAEAVMDRMQLVVVDQEFSPFYARRLALKMGLTGDLIQSVSDVVEKMFRLFMEKDLDVVEINPLGVSASGEVMALDGKVTANDAALNRHADLALLAAKNEKRTLEADGGITLSPHEVMNLNNLQGNIGVLCNGTGLMMATLDLIDQAGGKPACGVNVGGTAQGGWTAQALCDRLGFGLEVASRDRNVKVLLIDLVSSVTRGDQIARVIEAFLKHRLRDSRSRQDFQVILRLIASEVSKAAEVLKTTPVILVDSLEEAVAQAVAMAKSPKSSRNGSGKHEVREG